MALLLLTWYAWIQTLETHRFRWFALLGVLVGYMILVRPLSVIVPVVVLAGLGLEAWRRPQTSKALLKGAALALALIVGVSGSWMVRLDDEQQTHEQRPTLAHVFACDESEQ